MIRTCPKCEKEFDTTKIGSGYKYCSIQCRTKPVTGELAVQPRRGRPARFPKLVDGQVLALKIWLGDKGMLLEKSDMNDKFHQSRTCFASKHYLQIRVMFGGGSVQREKWAHACVYYENKSVRIGSTCRKITQMVQGRRKMYGKRAACNNIHDCEKCIMAHRLKVITGLIVPVRQEDGTVKNKYNYAMELPTE